MIKKIYNSFPKVNYTVKRYMLKLTAKVKKSECFISNTVKIKRSTRFIFRRKGYVNIYDNTEICDNSKIIVDGGR